MKTITKNGISFYIFEDNEVINITNENITIGDPETLIIADCNINNTTLYENVTPPTDWERIKYFFDGLNWTLNTSWDAIPK